MSKDNVSRHEGIKLLIGESDTIRGIYMNCDIPTLSENESLRQQLAAKNEEIGELITTIADHVTVRNDYFEKLLKKDRELAASQAREAKLREALNKCADKFHDYAELHAMKEQTPENVAKVERNIEMAAMCNKALSTTPDTAALEEYVMSRLEEVGEVTENAWDEGALYKDCKPGEPLYRLKEKTEWQK